MALTPTQQKEIEDGLVAFLSRNRVPTALSRPEIAALIAACDAEMDTFLDVTLPGQLIATVPAEAAKATEQLLDTILQLTAQKRWQVKNG